MAPFRIRFRGSYCLLQLAPPPTAYRLRRPQRRQPYCRQIGVTTTTTRAILKGSPEAALTKSATMYGFEPSPDHVDEWIKADRVQDLKAVGYRVWTDAMIDDAVQRLRASRSCAVVAKHMGVTAGSLYQVLGRRKISLRALKGDAA